MADVNLNNGHRYTFGKINDNAVLAESTDFVQETAIFRQGVDATGSISLETNSNGAGFRLLDGDLLGIISKYVDSGELKLYNGGSLKVKITAAEQGTQDSYINNGNDFGIGTDSPEARLHVNSGNTNIAGHFESTDGTIRLLFEDTAHTSSIGHDSTRMSLGYKIIGSADNLSIRTNGNVGIGEATPGRKFVVKDNTAGTGNPVALVENEGSGTFEGIRINFPGLSSPGGAAEWLTFYGNGVELDSIEGDSAGGARFTGQAAGTYSDMRNKKDVVYLNDTSSSLNIVNNLDVIEFSYKTDTSDTPGRRVGFSAQQLLDVYPHPVTTFDEKNERDGLEPGDVGFRYHKVAAGELTPLLTQAIKELTSEIQSLKARIQELENK